MGPDAGLDRNMVATVRRVGRAAPLLRWLAIIPGLPVVLWISHLASYAENHGCQRARSVAAQEGVAEPASRATFLSGGEAARVGPGLTDMDFAGRFWKPSHPPSRQLPGPHDTVTAISGDTAVYRFTDGGMARYTAAGDILCRHPTVAGIGTGIEVFVYSVGGALVLCAVTTGGLRRRPLLVGPVLVALCAVTAYLFWRIDLDVPVSRPGLIATTAVFAAAVALATAASDRARRAT